MSIPNADGVYSGSSHSDGNHDSESITDIWCEITGVCQKIFTFICI